MVRETINKKILVVDDEEEVLTFVANILKRANYVVASTTRGSEVEGLAIDFKPNLIILDLVLPDIYGGEIASALSRKPITANIPIILLTGFAKGTEASLKERTGKHYLMAKPVVAEDLLRAVNDILFN